MTLEDKLTALIIQENAPFGPSPKTGGKINKISAATAQQVAQLLIAACTAETFSVPLAAAWIRGESRFDPNALNPNLQDAKHPNETPEEVFHHTDVGIGQIDGNSLAGLLPGLTWEQQRDKALDPTWAVPMAVKLMVGLFEWAKEQDAFLHRVGISPNYGLDYLLLCCEAYNVGKSGALARVVKGLLSPGSLVIENGKLILRAEAQPASIAKTDALVAALPNADYGYGAALLKRYDSYKSLLA